MPHTPDNQDAHQATWEKCKKWLLQHMREQEYRSWIEPLSVDVQTIRGVNEQNHQLQVTVLPANHFKLETIKKKYLSSIERSWQESSEIPVTIRLLLENSSQHVTANKKHARIQKPAPKVTNPTLTTLRQSGRADTPPRRTAQPTQNPTRQKEERRRKLNAGYTFDTLVEGGANHVARAAGLYVAGEPGTQYNPLMVYGGVGLGKTHLLHAIGNAMLADKPNCKIICINAEQFVSDISKAARKKNFSEFQSIYSGIDLLLIDDVQFFSNKEKSQEEFFNLFEKLLQKQAQIVMSSDTYPKQMQNIEERLRSRFAAGLVVEVEPPKLEMRANILYSKAEQEGIELAEEVAFFIAKNIRTNIRELEGALTSVIAFANFNNTPITIETAKHTLRNHISLQNRQISVEYIQKTVADYYKIKLQDMFSKSRKSNIVRPRQVAMYLAKELTKKSLQDIGKDFGGKDHSTVLYAVNKIDKAKEQDSDLRREMTHLKQTLIV